MYYYYVATALPALVFDEPAEITFQEVMRLFERNLPAEDLRQVAVIRLLIDIYNLCSLWRNEPIDRRGNFLEAELEEALTSGEGIPAYVIDYLEEYETSEERLKNHGRLVEEFFKVELAKSSGFLHQHLQLERELRLVMVGFRAKQLGRDVSVELQWEDPHDEIVAQIIAQKDAKVFEPPNGYDGLKPIFEEFKDQPMELHRALASYRFSKVDQMLENELFSIGYLLGYLVQLIIVERLEELK